MTTDPVTLAREVLGLTHEDDTITVCTVPDNKVAALARAVIDLTAERDAYIEENMRLREVRARMAALADRLDAEGSALMEDADRTRAYPAHAHAARIRNALTEAEKEADR